MKSICIAFITVFIFTNFKTIAQTPARKKMNNRVLIKNLLDSQYFTFVPQSMSPLSGGFRNVTSYYDVRISKDTMQSYLPYFGKAYTSSIGTDSSPFDFTSSNIAYNISATKKHGWSITIKPKDKTEVQAYFFTVYDNGSATLSVTSTSRDPISYNGYITKNETKK